LATDHRAAHNLNHAFVDEPLYLDARWVRTADDVSLHNPRFCGMVANLAATIDGRTIDDLVGEDVRQHRTAKRLAWSAVIGLVVLTISASVAAGIAFIQRREAVRERQSAVARQLVLQGEDALENGLTGSDTFVASGVVQSSLLSVESLRRSPSPQAVDLLTRSLSLLSSSVTKKVVPLKADSSQLGSEHSWKVAVHGDRIVALGANDVLGVGN